MKYEKEAGLIDDLVSIAQVIPVPFDTFDNPQPHRSFGLAEGNISFLGFDHVSKFQEIIEQLFEKQIEIADTFTLKRFEETVVALIRILKKENRKCKAEEFSKIIEYLLKEKLEEFEILYDFYGARMESTSRQFGDFTIYNLDKSYASLVSKYPYLVHRDIYFHNSHSKLLVGVKVQARENNKAVEMADKLCLSFENVFSYAIADLTHLRRIGIINFRAWTSVSKVICSSDTVGYTGVNNPFIQLDLDNPFFIDPKQGNSEIWNLITKKNKNEIEKRLLNSIEWIGKGINDIDKSKSLVQFVFAIEGMLQLDEKTFITPSIVSQLSDWLAFIIHDEKESRKKISKYFKDVYQKRSAIAHGGKTEVEIEDLHLALQIAKLMTIVFLTTSPYKEMESMRQLHDHMTNLKFK